VRTSESQRRDRKVGWTRNPLCASPKGATTGPPSIFISTRSGIISTGACAESPRVPIASRYLRSTPISYRPPGTPSASRPSSAGPPLLSWPGRTWRALPPGPVPAASPRGSPPWDLSGSPGRVSSEAAGRHERDASKPGPISPMELLYSRAEPPPSALIQPRPSSQTLCVRDPGAGGVSPRRDWRERA
jgi:hypothetical protein